MPIVTIDLIEGVFSDEEKASMIDKVTAVNNTNASDTQTIRRVD